MRLLSLTITPCFYCQTSLTLAWENDILQNQSDSWAPSDPNYGGGRTQNRNRYAFSSVPIHPVCFKLRNKALTFHHFTDQVVPGLPLVFVYLDDVLSASSLRENHVLQYVAAVSSSSYNERTHHRLRLRSGQLSSKGCIVRCSTLLIVHACTIISRRNTSSIA